MRQQVYTLVLGAVAMALSGVCLPIVGMPFQGVVYSALTLVVSWFAGVWALAAWVCEGGEVR